MSEHFNRTLGRWMVELPGGRRTYRYRALMEQHLGRQLRRDEHVHHINGDRADDRIENLTVLTASEHAHLHTPDRIAGAQVARGDSWGPSGVTGCVECGTDERPHVALGECGRCYFRNRARQVRGYSPRQAPTVMEYVCEGCGETFQKSLHDGRGFRFCSKGCASRASARRRWAARAEGETTAIGRRSAA